MSQLGHLDRIKFPLQFKRHHHRLARHNNEIILNDLFQIGPSPPGVPLSYSGREITSPWTRVEVVGSGCWGFWRVPDPQGPKTEIVSPPPPLCPAVSPLPTPTTTPPPPPGHKGGVIGLLGRPGKPSRKD